MTVELKYRSSDARMNAFYLAQYLGQRRPTLRTERETARYLERAIKLLVAQAVANAAQKDLEATEAKYTSTERAGRGVGGEEGE